jgi:hypothetical protein
LSQQDLQLAVAAVMTGGDAIARYSAIFVTDDSGLYGGTADLVQGAFQLAGDELVPGVLVTGRVGVNVSGTVSGRLTVTDPTAGVGPVTLTASWPEFGGSAIALVTASAGGVSLTGTMPAP